MDVRFTFQKKDAQKRGLAPNSVGEANRFSRPFRSKSFVGTFLKLRLPDNQSFVGNRGSFWGHIFAPQGQLEESANNRSKPEVLISRVLKRDPLLDLGTPFERFSDWYLTFSCPKPGPGPHRIGPDFR